MSLTDEFSQYLNGDWPPDRRQALLEELSALFRYGEVSPVREDGVIVKIRINTEIRFG